MCLEALPFHGLMLGFYMLGSWLWNGGLDKTGWISHDHNTPVWIQGNGIIGEYRTCQMRTAEPLARKSLLHLSQESLAKLPRLFCGTGTEGLIDFEIAKSTDSNDGLAAENDDWAEVSDKYFHVCQSPTGNASTERKIEFSKAIR